MTIPDYARLPRPLKAIARLLLRLLDRPLPPAGPDELRLAGQLRSAIGALPPVPSGALTPSSAEWAGNIRRIRELVMTQDPRGFLRWDVIRRTMFLAHAPYSWTELQYLRSRSDWRTRWSLALKESRVGHPPPLFFFPSTSGNLLHHAYHLARFEEATGCRADELRHVVEFGGGYGSMCRLFFNLGFKGRYTIFDLPELSHLQEYYLSSLGLPVARETSAAASVSCIADRDQLLAHVAQLEDDESVFIATWSLSEASLEERRPWEAALSKFAAFLIAFQEHFREIDNTLYFNRLICGLRAVDWEHVPIAHLPGTSYLFGRRRGTLPNARTG